jgi:hypothetical protein
MMTIGIACKASNPQEAAAPGALSRPVPTKGRSAATKAGSWICVAPIAKPPIKSGTSSSTTASGFMRRGSRMMIPCIRLSAAVACKRTSQVPRAISSMETRTAGAWKSVCSAVAASANPSTASAMMHHTLTNRTRRSSDSRSGSDAIVSVRRRTRSRVCTSIKLKATTATDARAAINAKSGTCPDRLALAALMTTNPSPAPELERVAVQGRPRASRASQIRSIACTERGRSAT